MATKIAINGYGRIGKILHRISLERGSFDVVAINSRAEPESHAYLLKYDSVYGTIPNEVKADGKSVSVDGKKADVFIEKNPGEIDWGKLGVDMVVECTGKYKKEPEENKKHVKAGAKKVILSYPSTEVDKMVVIGVNDEELTGKEVLISNASCTTNALAPMCKVLHDSLGIESGLMTTIHAYTSDQRTLDGSHQKDPRRGRAAGLNMLPASTGATDAIGVVMPDLEGKLSGMAVRVPTPTVSMVDLVINVEKDTTMEEVNALYDKKLTGELNKIIGYSEEPLVSTDFSGENHSVVVQGEMTKVINKRMVKILGWYDNEWAYTERLADLIEKLS